MKRFEHIGIGSEKNVYSDASDPDKKVIMEYREKLRDKQIKGVFYLHKIIHLLFPSNVPDIYVAGNKEGVSYISAERISHDEKHAASQQTAIEFTDHVRNYPNGKNKPSDEQQELVRQYDLEKEQDPRVQDFIKKMKESGFTPDSAGQNYSIDENGVIKYLDMDKGWWFYQYKRNPTMSGLLNLEKIKKAISMLTPEEKKKAEMYLDRFLVLFNESGS